MTFQFSRLRFARLCRLVAIASLVILIGLGGIGLSNQRAIAATSTNTVPYDSGPVRKSRNPISNENFQGGVDQPAIENREGTSDRQLESDENKNLIDTLKDLLPGTSSETERPSPQSRFEPERNPTLERYTEQGGMQ